MTRIKFYLLLFTTLVDLTGCSSSLQLRDENKHVPGWINLDTIKAGKYDTGKMWTFEHPSVDYFKEEYNFAPSKEWLDHVRLSALRFSTYCSADRKSTRLNSSHAHI